MADIPTKSSTGRPRQRWCPWLLACVVLLLAWLTAAVGPHIRSAYRANREIDELRKEAHRLGGRVEVDYEWGGDFGHDGIYAHVDLSQTSVDDEQLSRLLRMPEFRRVSYLVLQDTQVTDRGLEMLVDHPSICLLDVSRTKITDNGLASIAKMRGLVAVNLMGNPITDRGIDTLVAQAGSTHLRSVTLYDTEVTSEAAERLRKSLFQASVSFGRTKRR